MKYPYLAIVAMLGLATGAHALPQALIQGGFMVGEVGKDEHVLYQGQKVPLMQGGRFILGFGRDAAPEQTYQVCIQQACQSQTLLIEPRTYQTQAIKGVAKKHVNPDPKQVARAAKDNKAIAKARAARSADDFVSGLFIKPVQEKYVRTGVYGSARTYNGEVRNWHKGLDFAAPTGTPVVAPAGGTVRLARDTFFNGNLIILDHGGKLFTIYAHLDKMDVKEGDKVKAKDKIGAIGTTGRSTGPHLHWGVYWGNEALDPALFLVATE
ncbi:MAG: peptidase [Alphaproteobacteria bacterium CG_4_10_14_0_8_um_filter_53_9]|nr:MAG: peptidase [Alphaproteobacteria bacterium CG_4_10_14_0_8_um_filter_53_9]